MTRCAPAPVHPSREIGLTDQSVHGPPGAIDVPGERNGSKQAGNDRKRLDLISVHGASHSAEVFLGAPLMDYSVSPQCIAVTLQTGQPASAKRDSRRPPSPGCRALTD
jgi:hypothetical protein